MRTITFLRWPSLNLKISSCSWYSACDNLQQDTEPTLVQFKLCAWRENPRKTISIRFTLCSVCLAFAFVLLETWRWSLGHGWRLAFCQELPLSFNVLSLGIDPFLLSGTEEVHACNPHYQFTEQPNTSLPFSTSLWRLQFCEIANRCTWHRWPNL